jgi:hypothetical protein
MSPDSAYLKKSTLLGDLISRKIPNQGVEPICLVEGVILVGDQQKAEENVKFPHR